MGSCVSVHKNPDSAMKFRISIGSKAKKLLIPSPINEKKVGSNFDFNSSPPPLPIGSNKYVGSKEESFFDTQAWLDSDCDDDFLSVNGDFTPSNCSTPNHQRSAPGTPQLNKAFFVDRAPDSKSQFSPTDKKTKLADLLRDSLGEEHDLEDQNIGRNPSVVNGKVDVNQTNAHTPPKSSDGTPYLSGPNSLCSSERTPNKDFRHEKEKKVKAAQCCLPSLIPNLSFNERKKRLSPGRHNGG
ncbi:uncharacterized protein At3g27210-like [Tasmannia lanceolata]|uniref:uncharacterized protein At3g27210-like n=1 Tax=Tasmannia lanceolata TaxID=3420 RepID=UPI0040645DC4